MSDDILEITTVDNALSAMSTDELATLARHEYEQAAAQLAGALGHFIRLGEVLHVARLRVMDERGKWIEFLRSVGIEHQYTADRAIRLAVYRNHLPEAAFQVRRDAGGRVVNPSWNNALTYLRGLPAVASKASPGYSDEVRLEAARLRKTGLTYRQVSEALDVGQTTVRFWLDSDYRKRKAEANRRVKAKANREATQLRQLKVREERDALARSTSSDLSTAYGNLRKALAALDRAISGTADLAVAGAARRSMGQMHSAENSLVEAMRAQRCACGEL